LHYFAVNSFINLLAPKPSNSYGFEKNNVIFFTQAQFLDLLRLL